MSGAPGRDARGPALRARFVLHIHGLERAPDAGSAAPDNYPPYDLVRLRRPDGDRLLLVLAVAGFAPERLEITVAGDQLSISGEGTGDGDPNRFLYRGIAARRFRRAFRLAPGLEVLSAELDRGLLSILLAIRPTDRVDRTIVIGPGSL
ncbi:Hsp20 family protein [Lichenibacterium ramalinae]|uniref:Heat-shock protein Hsp20 n=1 Tax=Lichenibacterium ramalinae TaxID=2316527 RepID=A0A4Q2RH01_9HYPH|nr:Hsp20 family protein [Lichenibacterium ramalinae]RYB07253.1 heat-shock protein Hsp20 [Lichenibacterium ramalinae]